MSVDTEKSKVSNQPEISSTQSRTSFAHEMDMGTEKPIVTNSPKVLSPPPKIPDTWILTKTHPKYESGINDK